MTEEESITKVAPRPALVHYKGGPAQDSELFDAAYITAEGIVETCRARGNTMDPAVYLIGEHFGMWALLTQRDDPTNPIWYEENVTVTDAHTRILELLTMEIEC